MDNISKCQNISLDLSASSIRYTIYPHLLVVIATVMCIVAAFVVGSNALLIITFMYSRYHEKYINRSDRHNGFSDNKKILSISFSLNHLIIGSFCMPLAIVQVVNNRHWYYGPSLCMARVYVETMTEVITIYHTICMCLDTFTMVRKPFKYRLLTSKTGYGMSLFCWAIPILVFVLTISLGWHTEGIGDALYCLDAYNTCIPIMSRKFLLFVLPISVIVSLFTLVAMAALVLKEIHRFHQRQDLDNQRNNVRKSNLKMESTTNHNDSRTCSKTCQKTFQDIFVISRSGDTETSPPETQNQNSETSVSVIGNELVETGTEPSEIKTPIEIIEGRDKSSTALYVNSKSNSRRKVYGIAIILTVIQCLYFLAFVIFASLFVYYTKMFPLWSISFLIWLRYVHSAMIPVNVLNNKPVIKLIRVFLRHSEGWIR